MAGSVFTYIPELPEGYALAGGVTIPEIQIQVGESSIAAYALKETSYTYDMSTGSVKIEEGSTDNTLKVTSEITAVNTTGIVQDNISKDITLTLTGTDATNDYNVVIDRARDVNLTLNGVSLKSTSTGSSPVILQAGAEAALKLVGENTLDSSAFGSGAGLTVSEGTKITIAGEESLEAMGGSRGAGIGGGKDGESGTFTTTGTPSRLGNAFIRASSIQDETYLSDSSNTQGIIFIGKVGTVYGSVTLPGNVVIKAYEIKESRRIGTKDFKIVSDRYAVSYGDNINPGEGKIIFTDKEDNTIVVEKPFTIYEKKSTPPQGTNDAPVLPASPTSPKTGDESNLFGLLILLLISGGACAVILAVRRTRGRI